MLLRYKQDINLSDEATVEMIRENPHCQYFIGVSEFTDIALFDSSKMVAFRKRYIGINDDKIKNPLKSFCLRKQY